MKKAILNSFIDRYSLGGNVQSVRWTQNGVLKTRFISSDQTVIGEVEHPITEIKYFDSNGNPKVIPDDVLIFYNTQTFQKLLQVADDDVSLTILDDARGVPYKLRISDSATEVDYLLADKTVVQPAPPEKNIPEFEVEFSINKDFVDKFTKARAAMSDIESFRIKWKNSGYYIYIGTDNENGNKIAINIPHTGKEGINDLKFSAMYLKEILNSNKDFKTAKLFVTQQGLAKVELDVPEFKVKYYLLKLK